MTDSNAAPRRNPVWALLPVLVFVGLAVLFWKGLSGDPSRIPSPLIDKSVPQFSLPPITGSSLPGLQDMDLKTGQPTLVNIWASWCAPCRQEHPLLMELSKTPGLTVVGINYKDEPENALRFLGVMGNPFSAVGMDVDGRVAIDFGDYGVPETFLVDGEGTIRGKIIGQLYPATVREKILPFIEKYRKK
jgi:cytochrome c biogenesis protein CcmG, thiol:disulfide interchange protein DsbE